MRRCSSPTSRCRWIEQSFRIHGGVHWIGWWEWHRASSWTVTWIHDQFRNNHRKSTHHHRTVCFTRFVSCNPYMMSCSLLLHLLLHIYRGAWSPHYYYSWGPTFSSSSSPLVSFLKTLEYVIMTPHTLTSTVYMKGLYEGWCFWRLKIHPFFAALTGNGNMIIHTLTIDNEYYCL